MALRDIYLDPLTNDLSFINGEIRLTESIEEVVRQKVSIALRTYRGEWFANIEQGVPYLENDNNPIQILGKTSKTVFDTTVRSEILEVQGVTNVTYYESTLDRVNSTITISFQATTKSGEDISLVITEEI